MIGVIAFVVCFNVLAAAAAACAGATRKSAQRRPQKTRQQNFHSNAISSASEDPANAPVHQPQLPLKATSRPSAGHQQGLPQGHSGFGYAAGPPPPPRAASSGSPFAPAARATPHALFHAQKPPAPCDGAALQAGPEGPQLPPPLLAIESGPAGRMLVRFCAVSVCLQLTSR
jgi:hypothetical protein